MVEGDGPYEHVLADECFHCSVLLLVEIHPDTSHDPDPDLDHDHDRDPDRDRDRDPDPDPDLDHDRDPDPDRAPDHDHDHDRAPDRDSWAVRRMAAFIAVIGWRRASREPTG
jgi:hypothetical protein